MSLEFEMIELIEKLVGPVFAIGNHQKDKIRLRNLKNLIELVEDIILDIQYAARDKDREQCNMKAIGQCADNFLKNLYEELKERYE